jgi:hypothetical protein
VGLILDSSVAIAAERLGQTAYQMLEAIGLESNDAEIAIYPCWNLRMASAARTPHNGGAAGSSSSTTCSPECPYIR